jgi:hypothetical protein
MHNEREENSITRPRETERLYGELEIAKADLASHERESSRNA